MIQGYNAINPSESRILVNRTIYHRAIIASNRLIIIQNLLKKRDIANTTTLLNETSYRKTADSVFAGFKSIEDVSQLFFRYYLLDHICYFRDHLSIRFPIFFSQIVLGSSDSVWEVFLSNNIVL